MTDDIDNRSGKQSLVAEFGSSSGNTAFNHRH